MRMRIMTLVIAGVACGGGAPRDAATAEAAEAPAVDDAEHAAAAAPPAPVGAVHEVEMRLTADGRYVYEPASLTIRRGDVVRWRNVSGGPHNVAFRAEGIPRGAAPVLNTAMANRMANLAGGLLIQPGAVYEIAFAGVPAGIYDYYCTPHEALGMTARLTVTE